MLKSHSIHFVRSGRRWFATFCWSSTLALSCGPRIVWAVHTHWTLEDDGLWTNAGNWDNGEPDNATFDVYIDEDGAAVTVTLDAVCAHRFAHHCE